MSIGKPPPLTGQAVDVRGLEMTRSVASQIPVSQIVGKDDYDARRCIRR